MLSPAPIFIRQSDKGYIKHLEIEHNLIKDDCTGCYHVRVCKYKPKDITNCTEYQKKTIQFGKWGFLLAFCPNCKRDRLEAYINIFHHKMRQLDYYHLKFICRHCRARFITEPGYTRIKK